METSTLFNARIFIPGTDTQMHRFTKESPYTGDIAGRLADCIWLLKKHREGKRK